MMVGNECAMYPWSDLYHNSPSALRPRELLFAYTMRNVIVTIMIE